MYATEFDLVVAQDQLAARRDEMKAIRMAQAVQTQTTERPSLLNRLILTLTTRSPQIEAPRGKVGAAA